jgi:NAD(P)-dependent dehydrogenase (short-subunit alcohol dehydrogenase family)
MNKNTTELVVFTGASKGPGLVAAKSLIDSGKYHVVIPTHDISALQSKLGSNDKNSYTPMSCDLESFDSVKSFCEEVEEWRGTKKIDRLVLGASTYKPELVEPQFTVDGHEKIMQVNYLSHYLMVR